MMRPSLNVVFLLLTFSCNSVATLTSSPSPTVSAAPSVSPGPSLVLSLSPSRCPTAVPSLSLKPTILPSVSRTPTLIPTTRSPSYLPSKLPTINPTTAAPSVSPGPSFPPTPSPSFAPVAAPLSYSAAIFAGNGFDDLSPDGTVASSASLRTPNGLWQSSDGATYITDLDDGIIRSVSTIGIFGSMATSASLDAPTGIWGTSGGTFYVTDSAKVRKIGSLGTIEEFAGTGSAGFCLDGVSATSTNLNYPTHSVVDFSGNVYIAETGGFKIHRVSSSRIISTFAGTGILSYGNGPASSAGIGSVQCLFIDTLSTMYFVDSNLIRKIASGIVSTVIGTSLFAFNGDGGVATSTNLCAGRGVWGDTEGTLYLTDTGNCRVRQFINGKVFTIAGSGEFGFGPPDFSTPATAVALMEPVSVFGDDKGNLVVSDPFMYSVLKLSLPSPTVVPTPVPTSNSPSFTPSVASTEAPSAASPVAPSAFAVSPPIPYFVTTVAGKFGIRSFNDDNCAATSASLSPQGLWANNSVLYIAASSNYQVRIVDSSNIIRTFAGNNFVRFSDDFAFDNDNPTSASLGTTVDVWGDSLGRIFILQQDTANVRMVDVNGQLITIAGAFLQDFRDGVGTSALFYNPLALAGDLKGDLYVADTTNARIRKIAMTTRVVSTIAGNGTLTSSVLDVVATSAAISYPVSVFVDTLLNVYFCDGNNRIRLLDQSMKLLSTYVSQSQKYFNGDELSVTSTYFVAPNSVKSDRKGNVFIADSNDRKIRVVQDGIVYTAAGTGGFAVSPQDGAGTMVSMSWPFTLAIDFYGRVYSSDNVDYLVRSLTPLNPTSNPTEPPTVAPSLSIPPSNPPSTAPTTFLPSMVPTRCPSVTTTRFPTVIPTYKPSIIPTFKPSAPSVMPTFAPTSRLPTVKPYVPSIEPTTNVPSSLSPTRKPTAVPIASRSPSLYPTAVPSVQPTQFPTDCPTKSPSGDPSVKPSATPSELPSEVPSEVPSVLPSEQPSLLPSDVPTATPSETPSEVPSELPSEEPTVNPSTNPSASPSSLTPSRVPSTLPSILPTRSPSRKPSMLPSVGPSMLPTTIEPTLLPTYIPTVAPTEKPSLIPTLAPSVLPSVHPTMSPTQVPSVKPSVSPSAEPSMVPTAAPSLVPSIRPSTEPSVAPSTLPSGTPTVVPSHSPTVPPTVFPTVFPTVAPSTSPSVSPSVRPSVAPSAAPTIAPSLSPSSAPSTVEYYNTHPQATLPESHSGLSVVGPKEMTFKIILPFSLMGSDPVGSAFRDIDLSHITEMNSSKALLVYGDESVLSAALVDSVYSHAYILDTGKRSVAVIRDCNGDGLRDLIIGDPYAAKCFVLFGNKDGLTHMSSGFTIFGETDSDLTGWSVSDAGDVNNDTLSDIIVGSPVTKGVGAFYVIYGRSSAIYNVYLNNLTDTQGFAVYGALKGDFLGISVSGAGDVNRDGFDDVIAGAVLSGLYFAGGVVLVRGSHRQTTLQLTLSIDNGYSLTGNRYSYTGCSVSGAGDVNGDGYDDVIIGSDPVGDTMKHSYLVLGSPQVSNASLVALNESRIVTLFGGGNVVSSAGDVNRDGYSDVLIECLTFNSPSSGVIVFTNATMMDIITAQPTVVPTLLVTRIPTAAPSSGSPSVKPTRKPTMAPTVAPSIPTLMPVSGVISSVEPTLTPTDVPSESPTLAPSAPPSESPTAQPSVVPSISPTEAPSKLLLTQTPTVSQTTLEPTAAEQGSRKPISIPTLAPSNVSSSPDLRITTGANVVEYAPHSRVHYYVDSPDKVTITNPWGYNTYSIAPNPNSLLIIEYLNKSNDVIDLTEFPFIAKFSQLIITSGSIIITLPDAQIIRILNLHPPDINGSNFIFFEDLGLDDASQESSLTKHISIFVGMAIGFGTILFFILFCLQCISFAVYKSLGWKHRGELFWLYNIRDNDIEMNQEIEPNIKVGPVEVFDASDDSSDATISSLHLSEQTLDSEGNLVVKFSKLKPPVKNNDNNNSSSQPSLRLSSDNTIDSEGNLVVKGGPKKLNPLVSTHCRPYSVSLSDQTIDEEGNLMIRIAAPVEVVCDDKQSENNSSELSEQTIDSEGSVILKH